MWKKQAILILCILWIGASLAKSFRPTSFDYDYREDSRKASNNYRGKSVTTTPRPSFQQYWENFVRNIPTLPPLRWNMTNSLSNLFNAGAQQIMETPVVVHEIMEEEQKPNRRRKNSKRKPTTKKNKNRRRAQSRVHSHYYNYPTAADNSGYQQIQLQPLGVDGNNIMHFYEPKTEQYYAMQMVSGPTSLYNQNYYSGQEQNAYEEPHNEDEAYYNDESYVNDEGYAAKEEQEPNKENMDDYDNEYNNNVDEKESTGNEEYADDVVVADNWGYTDDEVFGDRKLKGSLKPTEPENTVKIQKHILKPETEEDVMILLTKDKNANAKRIKPTVKKETTTEEKEMESVRNVLGTFMKDDLINRRRQSANTKHSTRLVEKPRPRERYYLFPADFWLK